MADACQYPGLALESFQMFCVRGKRLIDHFDRDIAFQMFIKAFVDSPHRTFTEYGGDAIRSEMRWERLFFVRGSFAMRFLQYFGCLFRFPFLSVDAPSYLFCCATQDF